MNDAELQGEPQFIYRFGEHDYVRYMDYCGLKAELQEARRLLKSVTRGCVCMSPEVPLMKAICAFLEGSK